MWNGTGPAPIDEIFKGMPNVFGIADDILIAGYDADGIDHNMILK